jgi:GNAT superfamily N-acetyltransferase
MRKLPGARGGGETRIGRATTAPEIKHVWPVMRELRTHHDDEGAFVRQVQRQMREGYRLVYLDRGDEARAAAGYRIMEMLFSGRTLYIDDLVTRENDRSRGFGGKLFDWIVEEARREECQALTLDSGVQRFDAHHFYLMKRMRIDSHHFSLALNPTT